MHIPNGTRVKLSGNSAIHIVTSSTIREGLTTLYQLRHSVSSALHTSLVTVFDMIIIDNRQLYTAVIDFKIEKKKSVLTQINKDLKKFRTIKKELAQHASDEEELAAFISSFKTEKSKDLLKLIKNKGHIDFKKFLAEWV